MSLPCNQYIVIGGTGQTGHRVLERLVGSGQDLNIIATSRAVKDSLPDGPLASTILGDAQNWQGEVDWYPLNLESNHLAIYKQLEAMEHGLDRDAKTALIFAAAFTNVEACEADRALCKKINEENTIAVLDWAMTKYGAKVVFYSTDYVFDGKDGPYKEDHDTNPISVYGISKLAVEEWLQKSAKEYLIIRTTGVFDYLDGSKNFFMQMLKLWGEGVVTKIPEDQLANPTWAAELAKATLELVDKNKNGIYNVAGGAHYARHEFARAIARVFGFKMDLIKPVPTSALNQKARRPLRGGLICDKMQHELGWEPMSAEAVLNFFQKSIKH